MTDYFALLEQPRRPWLELDELKQAFHEKARQTHPDVSAGAESHPANGGEFAAINEAYQVLLNPKRRLHHLLTLVGQSPAAGVAVPPEVEKRFLAIATLLQAAEAVLRKLAEATTPLSRSLVQPELINVQQRLTEMLEDLGRLEAEALSRLRQASAEWNAETAESSANLQDLYFQFAYLDRWTSELQEKRTQLQL